MKTQDKIIVTIEEFAKMSSSEICKILRSNRRYAITGNEVGVDRHIVDKSTNKHN